MLYIGIDPGLSGGIVCINNNEIIIYKSVMPVIKGKKTEYDLQEFNNIINKLKHQQCSFIIERQYVRPVSGKRACFMTGFGYGMIRGIIHTTGCMVELVNPQIWMKALGINSKDKKGSIMYCKNKYPSEDWTATEKSKKLHDGLTDSACISIFGKRLLTGGINEKVDVNNIARSFNRTCKS